MDLIFGAKIVKIHIVNIFTNYFCKITRIGNWFLMKLEHFGVMCHFIKGDFEPLGVMLRVHLDVFLQVVDGHVFP